MLEFRRYTNLASAIHLLQTKTITLLNPATWDDKNDAYFMAEYKRIVRARTVALCFAESSETYHHWRVFSHCGDGVCIIFDKNRLLSTFEGDKLIRQRSVNYKSIKEIEKITSFGAEELPFMKRSAYKDEYKEFLPYQIDTHSIDRIILNPWMAALLFRAVKKAILARGDCSNVQIRKSTLTNSEQWREVTSKATAK